jgi:hypothetical protein
MTQVLPFERPPNAEGNRPAGGNGNVPPGVDPEEMKKAFERKLEVGTKVITDASGAPAP